MLEYDKGKQLHHPIILKDNEILSQYLIDIVICQWNEINTSYRMRNAA